MWTGVPGHGPSCETRTYPMRCSLCGDDVFYFCCSCGSGVVFDHLGPPWPKHEHTALDFDRKIAIVDKTVGREAASRYIAGQMMARREGVRPVADRMVNERPRLPKPPERQILREDPYRNARVTEAGVVREIIPGVDVYGRSDIPETGIGAAVLGELRVGAFAQITVHTPPLGEDDQFSYTFFVPRSKLAHEDIGIGDLVRCRLRGVAILDRDPVWVCDAIELLA